MTAATTGAGCLTAKGLDISLAALQRQDPYINNIVDVASQVALYTFNSKANEWEKTDVEGTLFVYTRLASPRHGFTIMNRLSMENLTEPITKELDFQLQDPFLLYRNGRLAIHGIWFYDKTDCQRIAELMKSLTRQEQQLHQQQQCGWVSPRALDSGSTSGVDILQMLTKARDEYDKGKLTSEPKEIGGGGGVIHDNPHLIKPIPLKPTERHMMLQRSPGAQHQDGESRPISLVSLFGSPHVQQPPPAAPVQPQTGSRSARAGVKPRPGVARSLSYDDPHVQALAVSPGGGPVPLSGPSLISPSAAACVAPQPCAAIQKLMTSQTGAPELQPLCNSADKRVNENGVQCGGGGGDLLQKLFPQPLALHGAPVPPPTNASSTPANVAVAAPCFTLPHAVPPPTLLPGPHTGLPVPALQGGVRHHQPPHQFYFQPPPPVSTQPLVYSPCKPLLPTPLNSSSQPSPHRPQGHGPGVLLPGQVVPAMVAPPQVALGQGVVSPHELLQRLQLVQQEQKQNQGCDASRPPLAPCFNQPQNQPQGQLQHQPQPQQQALTRSPCTSSSALAGVTSNQLFQGLPATMAQQQPPPPPPQQQQPMLISPSVFSQSKPPTRPTTLDTNQHAQSLLMDPHKPHQSQPLSRSQLQATLLHLIQSDSSFLDVIYEAYVSQLANGSSRSHRH